MKSILIFGSVTLLGLLTYLAIAISPLFWIGAIILFLICAVIVYDSLQSKHSILRNFPLIGRSRYAAEWMRPKLYQYFIESDIDGAPIPRVFRSIVYQRAKKDLDTAPFGTQKDVYSDGYECMSHSIGALDAHDLNPDPRQIIGTENCTQPYPASLYNISAMSYGSLSAHAIQALNGGAKLGGFGHNTGEGGISPHHLKYGGDLIFQIGTGYFGARGKDGKFSLEEFAKRAILPEVKMIEIKLSQGAKPGHGGILPAKKATPEIATIRGIEPFKDVLSPPFHSAFSTPTGLLDLVKECRIASGGKPTGFKLCVGHRHEFLAICKAMKETGIIPDFIAVDGGEGGTGAAPLEFTDSVGLPFREGLAFVYDALVGFNLKKQITLIAAGKILTGFHIFRAIAIGADTTYSARGMMLALGCIQALECNRNTCPVGVATQDKGLMKGLVVEDKKVRVANFHHETIKSFVELMAAAGIDHPDQINRSHIHRRVENDRFMTYAEIYPYISESCLLSEESMPPNWKSIMSKANAHSFAPRFQEVFIEDD